VQPDHQAGVYNPRKDITMLFPADPAHAATRRWCQATLVGCLLIVASPGAAAVAPIQATARAEANQLHAAIANGDVESLRYWLQVRKADASVANATEPDVTPLERCLGLAARVLDAPSGGGRDSRPAATPPVGLRVLQEMVILLHERGARLTDADRQRFSGPVLRWYDDAVSPADAPARPAAPQSEPPQPAAPAAPGAAQAPASSSKSDVTFGVAGIAITTDTRTACKDGGHTVYLVNTTQLSVTATVTTYEDGAGTANGGPKSEIYTVDPGSSWRLGCDTSSKGRHVRYELTRWR
jgi:hypothetical protein